MQKGPNFFFTQLLLKSWARCVYCKIRPTMTTIPTAWITILHTNKALWVPITLNLQTRVGTRTRIRTRVRTHPLTKLSHLHQFETWPSWIKTLQKGSKVSTWCQKGTETATNVEYPLVVVNRVGTNSGRVRLWSCRVWWCRRAFWRSWWRTFCGLSASTTNRDVPQSTTFGPVPSAVFAKVTWLREVVVVVVAEFCVCWVTTWAFELFLFWKLW